MHQSVQEEETNTGANCRIGDVESGPMRATIEDVDEIDDVAETDAVDDVA